MATAAVLRPNDSLVSRNPNPNLYHRRRKRSPVKSPTKPIVIGHVKILKRGENISFPTPALQSPETSPETVTATSPAAVTAEPIVVYAGSAVFVASPPPSSVPFPAFCREKEENSVAACDIRRMLGFDLGSIIQ